MNTPVIDHLVCWDAARVALLDACRGLAEANVSDEVQAIGNVGEAMRAYGAAANDKNAEIDGAEIRIRAERRLGELLIAQKETVGLNRGAAAGGKKDGPRGAYVEPRDSSPTLAEAGIGKKLSSRAQELARLPVVEFEGLMQKWRARAETKAERVTTSLLRGNGNYSKAIFTGENEWYTPTEYLEAARDVLGDFDLDPASSAAAQRQVQATEFFDKDDDGLTRPWRGRVWLNPPYSQPAIREFVSKMVSELREGNVTGAVMLTHNFTDTAWFHEAMSAASRVCFTRGRVKFVNAGGETAAPMQGQAFFYFGTNPAPFVDRFSEIGSVVRPGHVGAER